MTRDISERIFFFIQAHQLRQSELFRAESEAGLDAAQAEVAALTMRSFTELANQASGREVLWNAAHEAHALALTADSAAQYAQAVAVHQGAGLVKAALDDRYHGTVNTIARAAGVPTATVGALVEVVTLAALAVMGALAAEHHWSAQALGDWLRPRPSALAPLGAVAVPSPALPPPPAPAPPPAGGTAAWFARQANTLLAVVSVIAAAEFGYILGTRPGSAVGYSAPAGAAPAAGPYAALPAADTSPRRPPATPARTALPVVLRLENGQRQLIGSSSTESRLYRFLVDPDMKIDLADPARGWIAFDRIYFETNRATLTSESRWQLGNIASILQQFPAAKISIGGYTDVAGSPRRNLQLSQERAEATRSALVSLGVPAERLTAVGYGALDSIARNDTEAGRALNRRVSLQVVQK